VHPGAAKDDSGLVAVAITRIKSQRVMKKKKEGREVAALES
jgi:hypothetical protein